MPELTVPKAPTAEARQRGTYAPHELNPDLAAAHLAEHLVNIMPKPAVVTKPFVVWQGIFKGLNHTGDNKTYFDCSALISILDSVAYNSVNINGAAFEKEWQYLMKPKMVVQGLAGQTTFEEEEKQSFWDRMKAWWSGGRGGDTNDKSG